MSIVEYLAPVIRTTSLIVAVLLIPIVANATVCYSIKNHEEQILATLAGSARWQISIACDQITERSVIQSLSKAAQNGVHVRILCSRISPGLASISEELGGGFEVKRISLPDDKRSVRNTSWPSIACF